MSIVNSKDMATSKLKQSFVIFLVLLTISILLLIYQPSLTQDLGHKVSFISSNVVINNWEKNGDGGKLENNQEEGRFPVIHYDRSLMLSNRKHSSIPLLYYKKDIKKSKVGIKMSLLLSPSIIFCRTSALNTQALKISNSTICIGKYSKQRKRLITSRMPFLM